MTSLNTRARRLYGMPPPNMMNLVVAVLTLYAAHEPPTLSPFPTRGELDSPTPPPLAIRLECESESFFVDRSPNASLIECKRSLAAAAACPARRASDDSHQWD